MNWISVKDELPKPEDNEVIGFSPDWIDEDFNPNGTRVCFPSGMGGWISAKWCYTYEVYVETDETQPTHWMRIPKPF